MALHDLLIRHGLKATAWAAVVSVALVMAACGQDPAFQERLSQAGKSADGKGVESGSGGSVDDDGMSGDGPMAGSETGAGSEGSAEDGTVVGETGNPEELLLPGDGGGADWMPGWTDGDAEDADTPAGPVQPGDGTTGPGGATGGPGDGPGDGPAPGVGGDGTTPPEVLPTPDIPAADDEDLDALHKCLAKWKGHPFTGTVDNYQKIAASISIGGYGNAINDTESTDEPYLILVEAGVNVLGSTNYNLLNKNGYYCIKVNVNVLTTLNVNLHCNARLADSKVNVNVGSTQNDTTSGVGVHVLSEVNVNTVRPEGDTCIR